MPASLQRHHHSEHHLDVTGGALRAGVFGAMDGLVSNFALIAGVVGAGAMSKTVVLTGLAGLAAGAFSMAAGEYISVKTQTEATEAEIEKERREVLRNPEAETRELAAIYAGYGVSAPLAMQVSREIMSDPDHAWRVHAREELGVDPDDLPSPYVAAGSSFVAFAFGAMAPLLPFLFGFGGLAAATVIACLALFTSGAVVARLTTRSPIFGGLRQLALGAAAAAATFGLGHLVGAGLA